MSSSLSRKKRGSRRGSRSRHADIPSTHNKYFGGARDGSASSSSSEKEQRSQSALRSRRRHSRQSPDDAAWTACSQQDLEYDARQQGEVQQVIVQEELLEKNHSKALKLEEDCEEKENGHQGTIVIGTGGGFDTSGNCDEGQGELDAAIYYLSDSGSDKMWEPNQCDDEDTSEEERNARKKTKLSEGGSGFKVGSYGTRDIALSSWSRASGTSGNSGSSVARGSPVWPFFFLTPEDGSIAVCNVCHQKLSRGRPGTHLGTSSLIRHMKCHHSVLWEKYIGQPGKVDPPHTGPHVRTKTALLSSTAEVAHSTPSAQQFSVIYCSDEEGGMNIRKPKRKYRRLSAAPSQPSPHQQERSKQATFSAPPPLYSNLSTVVESQDRKQKFPPSHPLICQLNARLAKLLVLESLPCQLVESIAFHKLMECAQPQWRIPSRHYFTNKAVPALYAHVAETVAGSLDFSVCSKVHATVDTWRNSYNQGHYLTFTAHWVNLVAGGNGTAQQRVVELVTPPRMSTSDSPPPYHTYKVKRCHSVLHLMSLGNRRHTAEDLLSLVHQQTNQWFSPRLLKVSNVVSDNSKNVAAAMLLGKLTHIPCFANILNSVVQKFLKNCPGLKKVLDVARRLCNHLSSSGDAKNALQALQRQHGLPSHALLCDTPSHWNSTLQMLDRLYQQQKAVGDYIMQHGNKAGISCVEPRDWQLIRDVCCLLKPLEEAHTFVSRDSCGINDVLPVIFMLEKTLKLMEQDDDQYQSSSVGYSEGAMKADIEEDEESPKLIDLQEEEAMSPLDTQPLSNLSAGSSCDVSSEGFKWKAEQSSTADSRVESLACMASLMLACFQGDKHIIGIKERDDYWVATLLDPRYKSKIGEFFKPSEREAKLRHYQAKLCTQLTTAFSDPMSPDNPLSFSTTAPATTARSSNTNTAGSSGSYSLMHMLDNFFQLPRQAGAPDQSRKLHMEKMVTAYLDCTLVPDVLSHDPMDYWVGKLGHWRELSQFAIQLLSCPPSSVLSERLIRAAGSVITPKQAKVSTLSTQRSAFIKLNQSWISDHFQPPIPDPSE